MTSVERDIALFFLGAAGSVFGSLVGLGGAFVVIPVLRIAFGIPPTQTSGTALLLVFANTATSTIGYLRHGRVDVKLAIPLTIGAIPAAIAGVFAVHYISPAGFDLVYGIVLIVNAILVIRRRRIASRLEGERTFAHDPAVGVLAGLAIGFTSSFFGIGAGLVVVPLLLIAARMPPHVVAATSALVITTTSPVGIVAHLIAGDIDWPLALPLILGGVAGGGIAPSIAKRISSPRLITLLATALILAAVGLVGRHL